MLHSRPDVGINHDRPEASSRTAFSRTLAQSLAQGQVTHDPRIHSSGSLARHMLAGDEQAANEHSQDEPDNADTDMEIILGGRGAPLKCTIRKQLATAIDTFGCESVW